jgi:MoaA/NifB/PqqE/SkfB family radical SAM enzyme
MPITCDWIFNILVVLSDGKVVCGCADPYGERPVGDLSRQTLPEIWNSPLVREIRANLNRGDSPFCGPCGLKKILADSELPPQRPENLEALPRIFFEPAVLCNLSCDQAVCAKDSPILQSRSRYLFPLDEMKTMLAPVGARMIRLDFFNYGEPFAHPQALEMIEYIKRTYPNIYLYISTNGLLLDEDKIRRLAVSGADEITFSVDGPDQKTYARYRRGGDFAKVFGIMRRLVAARAEAGAETPFINWRYIMFRWNDSRQMMAKTRRLAREIGVDRLTWEITDHPENAYSRKYARGTAAWKKLLPEIWDTSQIGSAIAGRRFIAAIRPEDRTISSRAGEAKTIRVAVKNKGGALWPARTRSGRRLIRLGAQLWDEDGRMIEMNYARAFLPGDIRNSERTTVELELPAGPAPGGYRLKFDMVSEGVDWFESGGSPVVWRPFLVTDR